MDMAIQTAHSSRRCVPFCCHQGAMLLAAAFFTTTTSCGVNKFFRCEKNGWFCYWNWPVIDPMSVV